MSLELDLGEIIRAYANTRQSAWAHDRSETVGASEVFACARRCGYEKHRVSADPDFVPDYGAAARGTLIERQFVAPALKAGFPEGLEFRHAGIDQRTFQDGFLSATPDGVLVNTSSEDVEVNGVALPPGACILVEIKSIDPRADLAEPKAQHVGQVQAQIGVIRHATNYAPDAAIILYVDASFFTKITVFTVQRDDAVYQRARERAQAIILAEKPEDLDPEGALAGGAECRYCPYFRRCRGAEAERVPAKANALSDEALAEIGEAVARERDLHDAIEAAKQQHRDATATLKAMLVNWNTRRATADGWSVSWSSVKGRKTLGLAAIAAAGIDLAAFETEGAPGERLSIKLKKEHEK